jgi:hypothetical protein
MTFKEYIAAGGRHYCRIHLGYDLFKYVLKGIDYNKEPSNTFKQESEDIKAGKALVLCPKGVYITHGIDGNPRIGQWGVRVIYPRLCEEDWKKIHNWGKVLRELTVKEILEMASKFEHE